MIKNNKGFTLIELLVVVAIIGILSSVVLASLNSARSKAADSSIKANLANVRAQAEIFYDTNNTYTGVCAYSNAMLASAASSLGGTVDSAIANAGSSTKVSCHEGAGAWAVYSGLKTSSTTFWCVDSTGASKSTAAAFAANATVCP